MHTRHKISPNPRIACPLGGPPHRKNAILLTNSSLPTPNLQLSATPHHSGPPIRKKPNSVSQNKNPSPRVQRKPTPPDVQDPAEIIR